MQKKLKILIQVLFFLVLTATMSQKTYAAEVLFNPANSSFSANSSQTVNLQVNTSNVGVGGFTLFIDITGTIPSNLSFTPASVTGLDLWANTLTDITGGKRLSFSMNVPLGGNPYTNNTNVVMGTFNFTMPASGNFIMTVANSSEVVHATNYTNLLSNFRTSTYTVTTTPTNTPIPTPTNTIAPTATPTSTPAPTATLTPMPSVTQSPTFGSVDVSFRLEGVLSTIPAQAITFSLLNPDSDAPLMNPINQNIAPAANGTFTATLSNVPSGLVKVCVKGTSHLRRCTRPATTVNPRFARHVTVPAGGAVALDLASDDLNHLRAGDVNNSNTITQEDSQSILNIFTTGGTGVFAVPVAANTPQDINRDGYVSIVDIALNSINFDDFIIAGD